MAMTKKELIKRECNFLVNVGNSFDIKMFVTVYWGHYDVYNRRSFDATKVNALSEMPNGHCFKVIMGNVERILPDDAPKPRPMRRMGEISEQQNQDSYYDQLELIYKHEK